MRLFLKNSLKRFCGNCVAKTLRFCACVWKVTKSRRPCPSFPWTGSLEKKGENAQKTRSSSQGEKKEIPQRIPKGTWNDNSHERRKISCSLVEFLTCHFTAVGSDFLHFGGCCECNCYLSIMAWWRSRHFTAVTALGPQEVELEHPRVVVSWLL